jgi:glycosyltransferase involved in cell wall biosynthesis
LDWCPNTVVEALACGLPVLCSHNGGTKELVRGSGIIQEFEETYDFKKVPLYKPPMPDPKLVARGMSELLEWREPIDRPDLYMDHVAMQYINFILE